jgi:hypothetical protein
MATLLSDADLTAIGGWLTARVDDASDLLPTGVTVDEFVEAEAPTVLDECNVAWGTRYPEQGGDGTDLPDQVRTVVAFGVYWQFLSAAYRRMQNQDWEPVTEARERYQRLQDGVGQGLMTLPETGTNAAASARVASSSEPRVLTSDDTLVAADSTRKDLDDLF